jgi:hypothetical protein
VVGSQPPADGGIVPVDAAPIDSASPEAAPVDAAPGACTAGVSVPATTAVAAIAVDETDIYWVELGDGNPSPSGIVGRCGKAGCTSPTVLASGLTEPFDVVLGDASVFFSDLDGIHGCDKAACSPSLLASEPQTTFLAVDTTDVFFRAGGIYSCPLGGCSVPTTLAGFTGDNYVTVAIDKTDVYWVSTSYSGGMLDPTGKVLACAKTGCAGMPRTVMSGVPYPFDLAVDADRVYVTSGQYGPDDAGAILTCPKSGCAEPATLAGGLHHPIAVAADSTTVYWVDEGTMAANFVDGDVASCPKTGCAGGARFLATSQNTPAAIATDESCVYWVETPHGAGTGAIHRTGK